MELTENSTWILPALELNLCLRMLGAQQRMILPVAENDLPLERRMLDSFLYLMELGLVEPEGENFRIECTLPILKKTEKLIDKP